MEGIDLEFCLREEGYRIVNVGYRKLQMSSGNCSGSIYHVNNPLRLNPKDLHILTDMA
jgi:hypothetical protein